MGCHTWFYKPINVSYDDAKKQYLKYQYKWIDDANRMINNPTNDDLEFIKAYSEFTVDYLQHTIEISKRCIRLVDNGYCKLAVMNKYCYEKSFNNTIFLSDKNQMYVSIDEFHDIFRTVKYPTNKLFNFNDTLEFIQKIKNTKLYYSHLSDYDVIQKIQEYWSKYPNGMIDFG